MNNWENESIQNFVNEFSASNPLGCLEQHIQAKNGKKYLLLLAEEDTEFYNEYFQPMLAKIPKPKRVEY